MHELIKNLIVVDESEYHAQSGVAYLSSHRLQAVRETNDCQQFFEGQQLEDNSGFLRFGRMVHAYTLEGPQKFFDEWQTIGGPRGPRGGYKAPHELTAEQLKTWQENNGGEWVTPRELEKLTAMAESVWTVAGKQLKKGWPELTARAVVGGLRCQGSIDWISESDGGCIVDLKTTRSLEMLPNQIAKFGYVNQLAFYQLLYCLCTGNDPPPVFIVGVEKTKPFAAKLIQLAQYKLDEKRRENLATINTLKRYFESTKSEGGKLWQKSQKILA